MSTDTSNLVLAKAEPIRLPKRKLPPMLDLALPAVAIGSGTMLFFSVPNIIEAHDAWSYAKAGVLALSATAVSFGVNKLAIERGAPLATTGYLGAGLTSVLSILAVGGGLFSATYAGLTLPDVEDLRLQEHGTALIAFVGDRSVAASKASRVTPAINSIAADLGGKLACELGASCISGRGNGGHGPVARAVEEYAGRAATIAEQIAAGETVRQGAVDALNASLAEYQAVLGDDTKGMLEHPAALQAVDARIRQGAATLDQAVPVTLLSAYVVELQSGASVPGRPEAEARLNSILQKHGQSLAAVIGSIEAEDSAPPAFPGRTGVSDTLLYIAHFLPIAAIAAVVELVFPLVLWIYTALSMSWEKYKLLPPEHAFEPRLEPALPFAAASHPAAPTVVALPEKRRATRRNGRAERDDLNS